MKLLRRSFTMVRSIQAKHHMDDDNMSTASAQSTFTVESQQLKQQGSRRRVQFKENLNVFHRNTQMDRQECKELWSTGAEMKQFKAQTAFIAREINRTEKVNAAPFSYQRVVLAAYDACCRMQVDTNTSVLNEIEGQHLHKWLNVATSRIGLERVCIREIAQDKYARRTHVVDAVLDVQCCLESRNHDGDELMRAASQAISRTSRQFARELAKAQAANLR
jgi:hypothetical protein